MAADFSPMVACGKKAGSLKGFQQGARICWEKIRASALDSPSGPGVQAMTSAKGCPQRHDLQRLLAGSAPDEEAVALERHLNGCARCLQVLRDLLEADPLVAGLQDCAAASGFDSEVEAAAQRLIDRVRGLYSQPTQTPSDTPMSLAPAADVSTTSSLHQHDPRTPAPAAEQLGSLGPFEVLRELGKGGMGVVYLARQQGFNRLVALKRIRPHSAADPEALARFRTEAEGIARLAHPHIVAVYAWGEHEGAPYFALEYCTGGSLDRALNGQPQPPQEAARLVEKLARAVQAAHDAGVIHRDLKPANVLLAPIGDEPALNTPWGVPKLADFGMCGLVEADLRRTAEGTVAGSPAYMAPEQAQGRIKDIGPATDVWSLGVMLYEVLTGRTPFARMDQPAVLHAICYEEPARPSQVRPGVPAGLEAICLRCLRKRPQERYARAADLAEALRAWLGEAPANRPSPSADAGLPRSQRQARQAGRGAQLVAGLLLAVLLGLGAWAWLGRPTPTSPTSTQTPHEKPPGTPAPEVKPLTVRWEVVRFGPEGDNPPPLGRLGEDTFSARLNDRVTAEATLSEPVFAYLIAFNPTNKPEDREQFVPESQADRMPEKRDHLNWDVRLRLSDGAGLQVFAVVAARQLLPSYAQWRKNRPPLPWEQTKATPGVVWRGDEVVVSPLFRPGFPRGQEELVGDKAVIRKLAGALRNSPGVDAVSVLGFAVVPAE
jgi:serine/threonine protein kinase